MIKHNEPIGFYVDLLNSGKPFKFLKFGDGEIICAAGREFKSKEFFVKPEITSDYRQILRNLKPHHYNALQPLVTRTPDLLPFVPQWDWYNADVLHNTSIKGGLFPFFEALQEKNVVLICNSFVAQAKKFFANCHYQIIISDFDCYQDKDHVMNQIEEYQPGTVFLISASVLSEPVIYHSREDCTFIDTGSIFEPYLGKSIRSYHSRMLPETIKQNLGIYAER